MSWRLLANHGWQAPLAFAARYADTKCMALLYSGRHEAHSGRYSFLFLEPAFHAIGSDWSDLPMIDEQVGELPDWVGYLGYGMRGGNEAPRGAASFIALPDFWLTRYQRLFRFNHHEEKIEEWGRYHAKAPQEIPDSSRRQASLPEIDLLQSSMTKKAYQTVVQATVSAIEAGNFYQANITRKFHGRFASEPESFTLFERLCAASPAPYSAYIKHGGQAILSSSPECFLSIDADGRITSRPIKGSSPCSPDPAEDEKLRASLADSPKNQAENLMITDLMRHDLAQVSEVGSVMVEEQSVLYSYATIHHLVSTVSACKLPSASANDVIKACFPPGSMTGAPKRAAMHWCAAQEKVERGVYSGAIGWFGAQSRCDLSVVIRTILLDGGRFEFQVGGGIVSESDAEEEWRETLTKARGICQALGLKEEQLAAL